MDDVTVGHNGRDAKRWRLNRYMTTISGMAILGQSLMSMNALLIFDIRALWRSVLSARAPECQKLKMVG